MRWSWIDERICRSLNRLGIQTPLFTDPSVARFFAQCVKCRRVFPHWIATMTRQEIKARGFLGCQCGGQRLELIYLPAWRAAWWLLVRGWLIRHLLYRKLRWDPRIPLLTEDRH